MVCKYVILYVVYVGNSLLPLGQNSLEKEIFNLNGSFLVK